MSILNLFTNRNLQLTAELERVTQAIITGRYNVIVDIWSGEV